VLGNKLLIGAALLELAIAAAFLLIRPVAEVLGHKSPPGVGWAIALASIPVLLVVDALHKTLRRRARGIGTLSESPDPNLPS
jgi:hypothetical protein